MRLLVYTGASFLLAATVIVKTFYERPNMYSAYVYLSQSTANLMILTNTLFLVIALCFYGVQRVLFGQLRPFETEMLWERAWVSITETCIAMAMFRGDMHGWFFVMFVSLLASKVWGWIADGRLDFMDQQTATEQPGRGALGREDPSSSHTPTMFRARIALALSVGIGFNAGLVYYCFSVVMRQAKPDMTVMFGFEFTVLTVLSLSTAARFVILLAEQNVIAQQRQSRLAAERARNPGFDEMDLDLPGWEEKGRWIFYLDIATDFSKLFIYFAFFAILFTIYGLPVHILRDMILTTRSFVRRIADFIRYRNATRDMNDKYPDATREEVAREDLCIICREQMRSWEEHLQQQQQQQEAQQEGDQQRQQQQQQQQSPPPPPPLPMHENPERESERYRPKKLPCGHVLHASCLRSWLERQQICPTCRRPVSESPQAQTRDRDRAAQAAAGGGNNNNGNGNGDGRNAANANAGGNGEAANAGNNRNANANSRAARRPEPRFFTLGPIRVGFIRYRSHQHQHGASRQQQTRASSEQQHQNAQSQPTTATGGGAAATASGNEYIQTQLQALEQRVSREIEALRVSAEQLRVVGALQEEYRRLATSRGNQGQAPQGLPPSAAAAAAETPTATPAAPNHPGVNTTPAAPPPFPSPWSVTQFASSPSRPALAAGDPEIPVGLNLPAGWSLLQLSPTPPPRQEEQQPGEAETGSATGTAATAEATGTGTGIGTGLAATPTAATRNEPAGSTETTPTQAHAPQHQRVQGV